MSMLPDKIPDPIPRLPTEPVRRANDGKVFGGVERRRNPRAVPEPVEATEVTVFHELGKALTSSLQLDQVLRTIMEKINEVLKPDTWSLLLMDQDRDELYFQIATGKGSEALQDGRVNVGQSQPRVVVGVGAVGDDPLLTVDDGLIRGVRG